MNVDMPEKPAAMVLADAAMDVIHHLRQQGITTAADLARALNERGITTPRGDRRWHATQVQRVIATGMTRA
jgi:hypothetical protein